MRADLADEGAAVISVRLSCLVTERAEGFHMLVTDISPKAVGP